MRLHCPQLCVGWDFYLRQPIKLPIDLGFYAHAETNIALGSGGALLAARSCAG